jgi:hypothetical protein
MIWVGEDAYWVVIRPDHGKYRSAPRPLALETTQRYEIAIRYHAT